MLRELFDTDDNADDGSAAAATATGAVESRESPLSFTIAIVILIVVGNLFSLAACVRFWRQLRAPAALEETLEAIEEGRTLKHPVLFVLTKVQKRAALEHLFKCQTVQFKVSTDGSACALEKQVCCESGCNSSISLASTDDHGGVVVPDGSSSKRGGGGGDEVPTKINIVLGKEDTKAPKAPVETETQGRGVQLSQSVSDQTGVGTAAAAAVAGGVFPDIDGDCCLGDDSSDCDTDNSKEYRSVKREMHRDGSAAAAENDNDHANVIHDCEDVSTLGEEGKEQKRRQGELVDCESNDGLEGRATTRAEGEVDAVCSNVEGDDGSSCVDFGSSELLPINRMTVATTHQRKLKPLVAMEVVRGVVERVDSFRSASTRRSLTDKARGDQNSAAACGCAICLCPYEEGDAITSAKYCSHSFHKECIFEWLDKHSVCPCCREVMVTSAEMNAAAAHLIVRRRRIAKEQQQQQQQQNSG